MLFFPRPRYLSFWINQRGAMFGLDARISLAIFGALSIIAGAYTALNLASIYANSFAKEINSTAKAIELIHEDLEADVHNNLENNTDENAFIALYDKEVLTPGPVKNAWLGPYVKTNTPLHPKYGETRISKRGKQIGQECFPGEICYLWLVYSAVPLDVTKELNRIFDGEKESDQGLGDTTGRLQWEDGTDEKHRVLWFRVGRAMSAGQF